MLKGLKHASRQARWVSGGLLFGCLLASSPVVSAEDLAPASAQDILEALGPDANGLDLKQEALPDLFTITSKRIEENSKQLLVEQPYTSGKWKGGKAVIEYSRDLSSTEVNILDAD